MSTPEAPKEFSCPIGGDGRFDMVITISPGTDTFFTYNFFLNPKTPDARAQLERAFYTTKKVSDAKFESIFSEGRGMCYSDISNAEVITGLLDRENLKGACAPFSRLLNALELDFVLRDLNLEKIADFLDIPKKAAEKSAAV